MFLTRSLKNKSLAKTSFKELNWHLTDITKEIDDFNIEVQRCNQIISNTTGIAQKSLTFYESRFNNLMSNLTKKVSFLERYRDFIESIPQKDKKKNCRVPLPNKVTV